MVFLKANSNGCTKVKQVVREFGDMPGLKLNAKKSVVNSTQALQVPFKGMMSQNPRVQLVANIGKYLGSYIDDFKDKKLIEMELVHKLHKKLQSLAS